MVAQSSAGFSETARGALFELPADTSVKARLDGQSYVVYRHHMPIGLSSSISIPRNLVMDTLFRALVLPIVSVFGLENLKNPGTVIVDISAGETGICVQVIDDGSGFEGFSGRIVPPMPVQGKSSAHNHIGLNNTQQIIQYYYGSEYGLVIDTEEGAGTTVTLHIPCDPGTQEE